jgi:poly [ADP-ribose] polymerase
MLEIAKSGRAKCRKCKEAIAKGELRFGEETVNQFSDSGEPSYFWYHLACAAKAKPKLLKADLDKFDGEVPARAELEQTIAGAAGKEKPSKFPYAERAPTARSRCLACELTIEKGALRVAIEREVDTGSFVTKGAGYLHAKCAPEFVEEPAGLLEEIRANSTALKAEDLAELSSELAGSSL